MPRSVVSGIGRALRGIGKGMSTLAGRWNEFRPGRTTPGQEMARAIPFWVRGVMVGAFGLTLAVAVAVFSRYYTPPAPEQPIPFSHRFHVSSRKLNCMFCHPYATRSANAGLPSVQKCLLCHNVIIPQFPPVARVRAYGDRNEPIPWVRVNRVAPFVHFSHQAHLAAGFDCSQCHGNVKAMNRVSVAKRKDMNFCVTCHWRNGASAVCFTCHY